MFVMRASSLQTRHDTDEASAPPPSASALRAMAPGRRLIWYDYVDAWLNHPLGRVLDYGCSKGGFLRRISARCTERWGIDIDPDRVSEAGQVEGVGARLLTPGKPMPFEDGSFDTAIIMEVIEHVPDERAVLQDLARVLKPGGKLVLTTPHKGLLTFLDPGNVKFAAPGLHRFVHCTLLRRKAYYEARFGPSRRSSKGMIADFSVDQRPWHRHYTYADIRALAPDELRTVGWRVYYPGFRALWCVRHVLRILTLGWLKSLPWPLGALDRRLSRMESLRGDQLVIMFEKRGGD